MNKAASVKLSLRKLLVATLAIGPLAIIPAPLWATPPTAGAYVVTNGGAANVTLLSNATNTTISTTVDKTILAWATGNFNIGSAETWQFTVPTGGSILNKVGYQQVINGGLGTLDNAVISGTLNSNGKVFILANGNIVVDSGAKLQASGGLVLSTLTETSDFNYTTQGTLSFAGTSNASAGNITLGNATSATPVTTTAGVEAWSGNVISINAINVSGDFILHSTLAGSAVVPSTSISVPTGNLTITTNAGVIGSSAGVVSVPNGVTTLNTGGNVAVTLTNAANDFKTVVASVGTGTGGIASITDANDIILGASTIGQDLNVSAAGNVTTSGAVAVVGVATLNSTTAGNVSFANGSSAASFNSTAANGNITANTVGNLTTGVITSTSNKPVVVTTGNVATVNGAITTGGNVSVTAVSINSTGTGAIAGAANVVNFNGTAGNVVLPSVTSATLSVVSTGGSISQNASSTLTTTGNISLNAGSTGNITVSNNNALATATVLNLQGNNVSVGNRNGFTLGATNTIGNLTANTSWSGAAGGPITIGVGQGTASSVLNVGGNLAITTNGSTVADDSYSSQSVFGSATINTTQGLGGAVGTAAGASVTLTAASASPNGASGRFGQWFINAGTGGGVSISETSPMNIGNITGAALSLRTTQANSDILINGPITGTTATFNSNAGGNIIEAGSGNLGLTGAVTFNTSNNVAGLNLGNSSNSFGGVVTIQNGQNDIIVSGTSISAALNNVTSGNVSITTVGSTTNTITVGASGTTNATNVTLTSAGAVVLGGGTYKNLTINASDSTATSVTQTGAITLNGVLTVTSAGNVALASSTNNVTGSIVLSNVVGDTAVNSSRNLTVSGTSTGNLTATAGAGALSSFANPWNLTLGNLNVKVLTANVLNGNNDTAISGNSGSITQSSGSILHVENGLDAVTFNGNIVLANNGNSVGRVQLSTGGASGTVGSGTISYSEDATVKLGLIASNTTANVTSRFGSIIDDPSTNDVIGMGTAMVLSAPTGGVTLNSAHTAGTTDGNITAANITAATQASIFSNNTISLGNSSANSLQVVSSNNITQSGSLSIFGTSNFTATNNITLTGSSNNFGPVVVSTATASKDIVVTESGTLNLRTVTMPASSTGNFTATSLNADIISTGFGGIKPGGTVGAPGSGVITLNATNGNITVGDATTDFPTTGGVVFNGKNVSLTVLGGTGGNTPIYLGSASSSAIAGNLTVTSATGSILAAGNIIVSGNATFTAPTGNINISQLGNQFGTLKFVGNQVNVSQSNDMKILTGSSAGSLGGSASLFSGGNVTLVSVGGNVSFNGTVSIAANGNITLPKLLQANGTLTVQSPQTKDLSALSVSGDLNGKSPVNQGVGAYLAPQP